MPEQSEYTAKHFLLKFRAIPDELWMVGRLFDGTCTDRRCALGHLVCIKTTTPHPMIKETEESRALWKMFETVLCIPVGYVNDGLSPRYPQPTPKQRILAALTDIKNSKGVK